MSRLKWIWGLALGLALITAARAEAPSAFTRLRDQAQSVESLSAFLARYVGSCTDLEEKAACEANARRTRNEITGRLYYVVLDESAARMLKAGAYDPRTREFTIEMTPFFEASGFALTEGAPKGQDGQGHPRIQIEPIFATLPADWLPMDMERLLRTQSLKIHIVFRPLGLWSLPDKGGGKLEGVRAKFLAVRLISARTGEDVALRLSE